MRKPEWILGALIAATLLFIWTNSLDSREESRAKSDYVLEVVRPVVEPILGPERTEALDIRKCAHFFEFAALGAELVLLLWCTRRTRIQHFVNILSAGLAAAVADESIQILAARGPAVQDVLLDFCGVLFGAALATLVYHCVRLLRQAGKHGMISP